MELTITTESLPMLIDAVNNALLAYCAVTGSNDNVAGLFDAMNPKDVAQEQNELKQLYLQLNKHLQSSD